MSPTARFAQPESYAHLVPWELAGKVPVLQIKEAAARAGLMLPPPLLILAQGHLPPAAAPVDIPAAAAHGHTQKTPTPLLRG